MQTVRLRAGDRELAREVFAMMTAVFEEPGGPLGDEYLDRLLTRATFWAVAAVAEGVAVGGLTAHELAMTRDEDTELFLFDLAVRADWQRRGVGRSLLNHLRTAGATAGISTVFVPADNDDRHALDFYTAVGGRAEAVTIFTFDEDTHP